MNISKNFMKCVSEARRRCSAPIAITWFTREKLGEGPSFIWKSKEARFSRRCLHFTYKMRNSFNSWWLFCMTKLYENSVEENDFIEEGVKILHVKNLKERKLQISTTGCTKLNIAWTQLIYCSFTLTPVVIEK